MPDEQDNVTLEITLPQEIYDRVRQLAADGVLEPFPVPAECQPATAEEFVAEPAAKREQLGKALKSRVVVVQKMVDAVAAAVVGNSK